MEDLLRFATDLARDAGRVTDLSTNGVLHDDLLGLIAGIPHGRDFGAAFAR